MRRRGFRGKTRRFRKGPRFEVAQVSLLQTAEVTNEFTRDDPLQLSFPLLSQFGLITTGIDSNGGRSAVIDSSVRGLMVASVYYDFNMFVSPVLDTDATARFAIEVADCLFVDTLSKDPSGGQGASTFDPELVPNLYANQVGAQVFNTAPDVTGAGGFSEVFAFPDRILYRRWGILDATQLSLTGNTVLDSENLVNSKTASLKLQAPVDYAAKRIRRRAFMKDDQGLFCGINIVGHNPDSINVAVFCNAVIVYRSVR